MRRLDQARRTVARVRAFENEAQSCGGIADRARLRDEGQVRLDWRAVGHRFEVEHMKGARATRAVHALVKTAARLVAELACRDHPFNRGGRAKLLARFIVRHRGVEVVGDVLGDVYPREVGEAELTQFSACRSAAP